MNFEVLCLIPIPARNRTLRLLASVLNTNLDNRLLSKSAAVCTIDYHIVQLLITHFLS